MTTWRPPTSKPLRPERPAVLAREQIIEAYFTHPTMYPHEIATLFGCTGEEVMEIWDSRQLPYRIQPRLKKNSWGY